MTTLSHAPHHGLTRAVLRLHRVPLRVWAVLVVAAAGGLFWLHELQQQPASLGAHCGGTGMLPCATDMRYKVSELRAAQLLAWLPCAVAACTGAVLIGRELERGTVILAWTQSVTPVPWLAAKLAVPAAALCGGTAT